MELAGEREGLPLVRAAAQLCSVLLFAVLPLVLMPAVLHAAGADFLWDFRKEFLPAGEAILHGDSPYPPSLSDLASHANYVYPPLAAVLMAPFTWLPQVLAEAIFVALTLVAPALALWLLGVRDWRCFGLVYLWPPLLNAVSLGTLSTLLALAVAAGWRWRGSAVVLGAALAGAAVAKLFLWPLLVLFGSRRRAAAISVAVACIAVLASWALIGFAGMTSYLTLLQELSRIEAPRGYSPTSLALALGLPRGPALAVAFVVGLPLLVLAARLVRRAQGETAALACAVGASLALSPVVWMHYLILLVVPIAVARDRLGPIWFVPLLFWLTPGAASNGDAWRIAFAAGCGVVALTLWLATSSGRVREQRADVLAGGAGRLQRSVSSDRACA